VKELVLDPEHNFTRHVRSHPVSISQRLEVFLVDPINHYDIHSLIEDAAPLTIWLAVEQEMHFGSWKRQRHVGLTQRTMNDK